MGPLIAIVIAALVALLALAVVRGRLVSIALAGAECPNCRIPLVPLVADPNGSSASGLRDSDRSSASGLRDSDRSSASGLRDSDRSRSADSPRPSWEIQACPRCDHLVTTVGHLPSPLAECPACKQRSLVVYAEGADGEVVVDEWCDLCGRRARTTLGRPPKEPPRQGVGEERPPEGRVLPFRRRS